MRTLLRTPLIPLILIALVFILSVWITQADASADPSPPLVTSAWSQAHGNTPRPSSFLFVPIAVPTQDICESGPGPRIVESNDGGPYVESPRTWTCVTLADGSHALQSTP